METIKPIKNEQDYELALKTVEKLLNAQSNTPEGDALEVWSILIHEYEQKYYKIETLSAIEALKYEMGEQGLTQTALANRFGMSKSSISEILSGKKQMSVNFLKYLHKDLGIPASSLLA